jgi:Leucine-rich repeat (LRR) protein
MHSLMLSLVLTVALVATSATAYSGSVMAADTSKPAGSGVQSGDSVRAAQRARATRPPRPPRPGTFTSLDSALKMPDSVITLSVRNSEIKNLPPGVAKFVNLESIDLGGCGLTSFPRLLLSCSKLVGINLSDNPIGAVPNDIDTLSNLTSLSLRNTGIKTLPKSIGKCIQLVQIELQGNPLESLPIQELNGLPRLRNFGIGGWDTQERKPRARR